MGFQAKAQAQAAKNEPAGVAGASQQHFAEAYGKLPLAFEANTGQTSDQVKFVSRGQGYTLFLTRNAETVLVLNASRQRDTWRRPPNASPARLQPWRESGPPWVVRMKLVNADASSQAEGLEELPGKASYFIGKDPKKWRANVPLFTKVMYRNVYRGVDLVYYGNQQQLEHDFIVAPSADPQSIKMSFDGAESLSLDLQGNLVLVAKEGEVHFGKPLMYQEIVGGRKEVAGGYVLKSAHEVGFQVAAYDASKPLVIDPTLSYSTYLGGYIGYGIAVDAGGNAYVTGPACSATFPTTPGAFQQSGHTFVAKLNPTGSALVYATCLGGSNDDEPFAIAVDAAGNAYVTGYAGSKDFPTTPGAFQLVNKSLVPDYNAYVTKLNSTGSALVYSTYLGGSIAESGQGIAVDAAGNASVTGWTMSTDFPTTLNAFQPVKRASSQRQNAFVTTLNAGGTALVYSTYLGGSGSSDGSIGAGVGDQGHAIAVDVQGNAYVTGTTCSSDFPVTPLAFQPVYQGNCDAFVSELNPTALLGPASLVYSTFLGGVNTDQAYAIAADAQENVYVAGTTCSANFPVTPLAFQIVNLGQCDAFVTKLNPSALGPTALVYSTFLGGIGGDYALGIALDASGDAYVTGITGSSDFPVTPDAFKPAGDPGQWEAFVTVLNPSGSAPLVYSTYLGGGGPVVGGVYNSSGRSIAVDGSGNAYLTGWTESPNFPTTPGAFRTTPPGGVFVAKFSGFPTPQ